MRDGIWWINIPASFPIGRSVPVACSIQSLSGYPGGIWTPVFFHSGDLFIDTTLIDSSLSCFTSSCLCRVSWDCLQNYLYLNSCLQVYFGRESKLRQVVLVRSCPGTQCILCPYPCPQYKCSCMTGEVAGEGACLAGSLECQWAHINGGHVDILSVFLKMGSL